MSSVSGGILMTEDETLLNELARVREVSFKRFCDLDAKARQALEEYRLASEAHWKVCVEKVLAGQSLVQMLNQNSKEEASIISSVEGDLKDEIGNAPVRLREVAKPDYNISARALSKKETESFTGS